MKSLVLIVLFALIAFASSQQICLRDQCANELKACNAGCVMLMGKCFQSCTLSSLGCLQKCIGDSQEGQNLLECSFNKCINV